MRLLTGQFVCCVLATIIHLQTSAALVKQHNKRIFSFRKGSVLFYRMNFKANVVPWTTIFAHAAGFKIVWPLPEELGHHRAPRRMLRELHEATELMYDSHGFDGRSCLLWNICQVAKYVEGRGGVVAKILRLLAGLTLGNGTLIEGPRSCEVYANRCPLQLIGVDGFVVR